MRLVNGPNQYTGRVEVYANSAEGLGNAQWGSICDDNWDIQDARVVCRQLGYPDAVVAPLLAYYGEGTGPIWLDDVQCLGTESDLFACVHNGFGNHNCEHDKDASVECSGLPTYLYVVNCKYIYISQLRHYCIVKDAHVGCVCRYLLIMHV